MGYIIYREVLDRAPDTLTWQQRYILGVLADDANEDTRLCMPCYEGDGAHAAKTRRRAHCSRTAFYDAVRALTKLGLLQCVQRGQKGVSAVYRVAPMPGVSTDDVAERSRVQGPGFPDAETLQGPENPDAEVSAQRPGIPDTDDRSGSGFGGFSVRKTRTPLPHISSEESPPSPYLTNREGPESAAPRVGAAEKEREPVNDTDGSALCGYCGKPEDVGSHEWCADAADDDESGEAPPARSDGKEPGRFAGTPAVDGPVRLSDGLAPVYRLPVREQPSGGADGLSRGAGLSLRDQAIKLAAQIDFGGEVLRPEQKWHVVDLFAAALADGWPGNALLSKATDELDKAKSRYGLVKWRLSPEHLGGKPKLTRTPPPFELDMPPESERATPEAIRAYREKMRAPRDATVSV